MDQRHVFPFIYLIDLSYWSNQTNYLPSIPKHRFLSEEMSEGYTATEKQDSNLY